MVAFVLVILGCLAFTAHLLHDSFSSSSPSPSSSEYTISELDKKMLYGRPIEEYLGAHPELRYQNRTPRLDEPRYCTVNLCSITNCS